MPPGTKEERDPLNWSHTVYTYWGAGGAGVEGGAQEAGGARGAGGAKEAGGAGGTEGAGCA